ncbi:MAG: class I SAM-dependent methyltransferase [Acutalibacteraceae bacterium]
MKRSDNSSAFNSAEYDSEIRRTLPYYDEFYKTVIDIVRTYKSGSLKWLDVGCGTGKMAQSVFEQTDIEKLVFCDCSDKMIEIAKSRFGNRKNAEFIVSSIQELDTDEKFDVITAIQINHYLKRDERLSALKKYYQALKPNGILISFENFAPNSKQSELLFLKRWYSFQRSQGKSEEECSEHINRYKKAYFPITIPEHIEAISSAGFRSAEIIWLSYMQAGLLGIK